jgi:hypothetical protein
MLEQWNTGIMGSGRLGQWFVGKTLLTRELINERLPYKTVIPLFHVRGKNSKLKIPLFSISCRIADTFNYLTVFIIPGYSF